MSADRLTVRYRRLLQAYPPGPRREELLDTLLEAGTGRTRPGARETVNLLRHGTAARLARPGARLTLLLTLWVMLTAAVAGYNGGYWLSWRHAAPLPTGAAAAALKTTVFGDLRVSGDDGAPLFMTSPDGGDKQAGYAEYQADYTAAQGADVAAVTRGVRDRLAAAGWQIRGESTDPGSPAFWATRGPVVLGFVDLLIRPDPSIPTVVAEATLTLSRAKPAVLYPLSYTGSVLAALAALALSLSVRRRIRGRRVLAPITTVATTAMLILFLPTTGLYLLLSGLTLIELVINTRWLLHVLTTAGPPGPAGKPPTLYAPWQHEFGGLASGHYQPALLGAAVAVAVLTLARWPRRSPAPAESTVPETAGPPVELGG